MIRWAFIALLALHGMIHLLGAAKAFDWAQVQALTKPIARPMGLLWASAALLFTVSAFLMVRHSDHWWMPAVAAVVLSQWLIALHWQDARFGTIGNVLVLAGIVLGASVWAFRKDYRMDSSSAVKRVVSQPIRIVDEAALGHLPAPVQRYLRSSGAVGHPMPRIMHLAFRGDIRSKDGPWMPFTTVQLNTFDPPTRAFWMDATMKGLPTKGYHSYREGKAHMQIKVLGLLPVIDLVSAELDTAETVTWFNDLCLFAPGALVDERITWEAIDDQHARASFTHKGIAISAVLEFDEADRLVDFISDDRYYLHEDRSMTKCRFSTPARHHRVVNGVLVPGYGEAVYHLPDGDFTYGRFHLEQLWYDQQ